MAERNEVVLDDGYTISRLAPVHLHGAWHLFFVGWPSRPITREEIVDRVGGLSNRVRIEEADGQVDRVTSGGHGNNHEEQFHVSFTANEATAVRVVYRSLTGTSVTEDVPLTAAAADE